ncbi:trypsin inhibitor heavy chain H2 [Seminavis robusta]|uniref:Trypsin inhibitor heavy chain H2 n=1 Tax=Seminavis robusta TaxID=568900 RepID=A0A9N8HWM9_9STRA|nr:trypsin inhibitor heavy chain H2 [Seminavis robusta]|eukprot:Sro2220_g319630.1 trypsin inhibitor heavy chain H2 (599) ;mRNA; f:13469-15459
MRGLVLGILVFVTVLVVTLPFLGPPTSYKYNSAQISGLASVRGGLRSREHLAHLPALLVAKEATEEEYVRQASVKKQALMVSRSMPSIATQPLHGYALGGDKFEAKQENAIKQTSKEPVSTFSVDVDTSSYSYARRHLKKWRMPPPESIKIEEFINYFDYDYPQPEDKSVPFETSVAVSDSPWNKGRKLLHIGIKGYDVDPETRPFSNIVFLVDVSGSMEFPDKLPLAKEAIEMLLSKSLLPEDLVSIVTYANNVNVPLHPTPAAQKDKILKVLSSLQAGGGTWGGGGLEKAYELAEKNFDKDAVNRIILVTDGDFNIGKMDTASLQKYVEGKRKTGIFLSVLGFGMGNYKDTTMKALANHGNGVASYIDSLEEAEKVMVTEASSTVFPIAKDVKVQVEFNPAMVAEYRLVGYEKRLLKREDFNNDKVDAGDIGSGHTVTAIYEITPAGSNDGLVFDELRYGKKVLLPESREMQESDNGNNPAFDQEYAFVKMRYKLPDESESKLISKPVSVEDPMDKLVAMGGPKVQTVMQEFQFATAVASFAQLLKGSDTMNGSMDYEKVIEMAEGSMGEDPHKYRKEFINLVRTAKRISQEPTIQ